MSSICILYSISSICILYRIDVCIFGVYLTTEEDCEIFRSMGSVDTCAMDQRIRFGRYLVNAAKTAQRTSLAFALTASCSKSRSSSSRRRFIASS